VHIPNFATAKTLNKQICMQGTCVVSKSIILLGLLCSSALFYDKSGSHADKFMW